MNDAPPKGDSRRPFLWELERRLLLSADVPSLLVDPGLASDLGLPEPPAQIELLESDEPASQTEVIGRRELVIVDPGVESSEQLVEDVRSASPDRGIEVVVLDTHMSVFEGSIGAIPRRLMVMSGDILRARELLDEIVREYC